MSKSQFIKQEFVGLVSSLSATDKGKWGLMNAQQMSEHVADFFKVSTRQVLFNLVTPPEHLPKYKEFLWSEKEFRENTKAPMLPAEPAATRNNTMIVAIEELQNDINYFFEFFEKNENTTTQHPVFGNLNFEEWILLHYKHTQHHAKQFGLI